MKSVEASKLYEDESLDFVFIDADHTKEGFSDDMDCWFPKVKQGGVIAGHDYDYPVIKEIVNKLFNGQEKVLLPNTWVYYK
jgi:predicted O-methyltransferase YrrM